MLRCKCNTCFLPHNEQTTSLALFSRNHHHNSTTPPAPAAATTHAMNPGTALPIPAFVVAAAGALPVALPPLPPLPPAADAVGMTVSVTPIVMGT